MIICICGPTAVGKTKLSIELAKKYNAEIINFDSVQIYKKMDIVSAKVTESEKENIPHHLLDIKNYDEDYSVYDYQLDSRKIIDKLLKENKNIIMVGGTALYLKASLFDYRFNKEEKENKYEDLSIDELYSRIIKLDKDSKVDNNVYFIGLETDRKTLYNRINNRVDAMIENGLIEEAKYFYGKDYKSVLTPIGYKELFKYFDNEISLEDAIDLIKKNSRHYAKRQFTFFKNKFDIKWFNTNYDDFTKTIKEVIDYIGSE